MNDISSHDCTPQYRPDIDGLRAIAILSVVLYHAGIPWVSGGFTGVDIFFVISGYLIGGHIFSELSSGTFSFLRFYQRRAKRILPAFYVVLVFTLLAAIVLLSPFEATIFAKSAVASVLSISNIYFYLRIADYFHTSTALNPLLMTWSLGVEEQFYALIPLLMVLLSRIRRSLLFPAIVVVCALSFVFAWSALGSRPNMAFYLLPARAWELGSGVALAVAELSWTRKLRSTKSMHARGLIGLSLMLVPMCLLTSATPFPGPAAVPSVFGTALVIATPGTWISRRLLSFSPLVFIGKISYSWYLWHWPLLAFLRLPSGGVLPPAGVAFSIVASFAVAVLSYYFIEQPFRSSRRAPAPLLLRYAMVSLAFLAVLEVLRISPGYPKMYPVLLHLNDTDSNLCLADFGIDKPDLSLRCYAPSDPRPSILLWGDSHSGALAPALIRLANSEGYNFIQMSKADCLPLNGAALFVPNHPLVARECIHFNNEVLKLIAVDCRIRIVIMTGVWRTPFRKGGTYPLITETSNERIHPTGDSIRSTFTESLAAAIRPLQDAGKHVIVVDDVPTFDFDPLMRFETTYIPARRAIGTWLGTYDSNQVLAPAAFISASDVATDLLNQTRNQISGMELVDLKSRFCNSQNLCAYMDGNRLLFRDSNHLTADGAQYALRSFRLPAL